ncbi:MAG: hypothetical protein JST53_17130 [Actinobacteria bacterium]|nr:hypothetical protein [Actinomycetota bacterium]
MLALAAIYAAVPSRRSAVASERAATAGLIPLRVRAEADEILDDIEYFEEDMIVAVP